MNSIARCPRRTGLILWILVASIWPWSGHAAPQWCGGTVSTVWVKAVGDVFFVGSWRADHTKACNVNETWNGVSPATCLSWFVILQNAMNRQLGVTVFYDEAPACNALPLYEGSPTPGYIMNAR
jgi:hypothetical protein